MQKSENHIKHEPVFDELHLEEVADIPERVSLERSIEGDGMPEAADLMDGDLRDGEELADIRLAVTESRPVIDDYAGSGKESPRKGDSGVINVSSLASEVDILTRVSKPDRGAVGAGAEKPADKSADTRLKPEVESRMPSVSPAQKKDFGKSVDNEIVINEDDDIDIDYYSLEELEGSSAGMMDMPSADFPSEVEVPGSKKPQLDEFMLEPDLQPEEEAVVHVEKDTLTFEIPDDVREKTTEELELGEWEAIDLTEAEKIANEDILFLREDDLIEELEEFDLVPVAAEPAKKKRAARAAEPPATGSDKKTANAGKVPKEHRHDEPERTGTGVSVPEAADLPAPDKKAAAEPPESIPEIEVGEIVLEPEMEGEKPDADMEELPSPALSGAVGVGGMPVAGASSGDGGTTALAAETERGIHAIDIDEEGEIVTVRLEEPDRPVKIGPPLSGKSLTDHTTVMEPPPVSPARVSATIMRESIPEELLRVESPGEGAVFIDDDLVDKKLVEKTSIFEVSDLERITSEIVEIIEGEAKLLVEADVADDRDRIASVMKGQTPAFEDLLIDIEGEYSFKDDEMDVIDNAFAAEDYGRYIGVIDDFSEVGAERSISSAVELLGLDVGELGSIDQISFLKEYEKIDIDGILASVQAGMDQPAADLDILKRCTYIVSTKGSILEEEKKSIEEDVYAGSALVLEESVDELQNRLASIRGGRCISPEEGIPDISDSVIIIENGRDIERFVESMPEDKRDGMRKLLRYLDGLFEKLPEDVIRKFAKSEYFDLYSKVMNDLGV